MSIQRSKGFRQKIHNATYEDFIPFGTDGELVDMKSGLTLEVENKIGQDHYTVITEMTPSTTNIQEIYAKKSEVDAGTATDYYQKETLIVEQNNGTSITERLWKKSTPSSTPTLVRGKVTTIIENGTETRIEEVLE